MPRARRRAMRRGQAMKSDRLMGACTGLLAPTGGLSPCASETVEAFYARQRLTFIIPASAGGGFDLNSRVLMEYMPKYIPGQPKVVLQNMLGSGGIQAANYVFKVAPKDG